MPSKFILLQKETQLFIRIYALGFFIQAIMFGFFPKLVFNDVFVNEYLRISDYFSAVVIGVTVFGFGMVILASSILKGRALRLFTGVFIANELLSFVIPAVFWLHAKHFPISVVALHAIQLLVFIYLYKHQLPKKY